MSEWTPDRIELLAKLWEQGLSASQVAKRLGGVTRNAVIGKVHREGLTLRGRAKPSEPRAVKAPRIPRANVHASGIVRRNEPRPPKLRVKIPVQPVIIDATRAKPWTERQFGECAYPISGEGADTLSCCLPTAGTYCAGHAARMYVAARPKPGVVKPVFHNIGGNKQWAA